MFTIPPIRPTRALVRQTADTSLLLKTAHVAQDRRQQAMRQADLIATVETLLARRRLRQGVMRRNG